MVAVEINSDALAASVLFHLESKSNMASHALIEVLCCHLSLGGVHRKCYLFVVLLSFMVLCLQSADYFPRACYVVHSSFMADPTLMISNS